MGTAKKQKRKRRRTVLGVPDQRGQVELIEPAYESLPDGTGSYMRTLDVRIKVTPEVMRESGQFSSGGGEEMYDRIRVREGRSMTSLNTYSSSSSKSSSTTFPNTIPTKALSTSPNSPSTKTNTSNFLNFPRKCLNKVTKLALVKS